MVLGEKTLDWVVGAIHTLSPESVFPKEDAMQKNHLMERSDELVNIHGRRWKKIISILTAEGFTQDDGSPLTGDIIRKRYQRWLKNAVKMPKTRALPAQKRRATGKTEATEPETSADSSSEKSIYTSNATIPVSELLELFKGSLERRDHMLAEKAKNYTYFHAVEERISLMEARLEAKLLKRLKDEVAERVTENVDDELKTMLAPGGSFERDLKALISKQLDEKAQESLVSLLDGIDVSYERPPGPGRGRKGKRKTARFSATMAEETYDKMKDLPGTFSSRLTAACLLYLRALETKREHTE